MIKIAGVDGKYEHNCNCVLWCRNSINYIGPYSCTEHENSLVIVVSLKEKFLSAKLA